MMRSSSPPRTRKLRVNSRKPCRSRYASARDSAAWPWATVVSLAFANMHAKMTIELKAALYVVPTPIGNLADLTRRAADVLAAVPWIAAEDTRHSGPLLKQLGATGRLLPAHQHNEQAAAQPPASRARSKRASCLPPAITSPAMANARAASIVSCSKANATSGCTMPSRAIFDPAAKRGPQPREVECPPASFLDFTAWI